MKSISCALMRGGTSKGVFFSPSHVPARRTPEAASLYRFVLGSPDPTSAQLNGLGGGNSSTSKVCIVGISQRVGFDLDYDFVQVDPVSGAVDWEGNCGNLSSAVLPFAQACLGYEKDHAKVFQVNTEQEMICRYGALNENTSIPGVPGMDRPIYVDFVGDERKIVLPTQKVVDIVHGVPATLIFSSNPTVFVPFEYAPPATWSLEAFIEWRDDVKTHAAELMGIANSMAMRVAFVRKSEQYVDSSGREVNKDEMDFFVTMTADDKRKFHHALTGTGLVNCAIAARIPGTVVHAAGAAPQTVVGEGFAKLAQIRIGNPSGVASIRSIIERNRYGWVSKSTTLERTARVLMIGEVFA